VPNKPSVEPLPEVCYDDYGFMVSDEEKAGIFGTGCVRRPIDVATCVQESTAAALKAIQTVARR
jgi:quinone-modifying oxidoreductase, subunit QmoA